MPPDQVKSVTQHVTDQTFERYMLPEQISQLRIAGIAASKTPSEVVGLKKRLKEGDE